MSAHYDNYDYPAYWEGRKYEHDSEFLAMKLLLGQIPEIEKILEIGAGYGRLVPTYLHRSKKIILSDPSAKLLSLAREKYEKEKKVNYLHSSLENLPTKLKKESIDLAIMVRVMHHIEDIDQALEEISYILKDGGYLILEFANKAHSKAVAREFLKGNFTFPLDIFPKDIRCKRSIKKKSIPFINYHPDAIIYTLQNHGFAVKEKLSVSNIRSSFMKRFFSTENLLSIEKVLQKPLGQLNFGPSIFLLIRKEDTK